MARQKANPLDTDLFRGTVHNVQQIGQIRSIRDVLAITIDDLPKQCHFLHALRRQAANLRHNLANAPAALNTAAKRYDAEGTSMRTTVNNRDVRAHQLTAFMQGQDELAILQRIAFVARLRLQLKHIRLVHPLLEETDHRRRIGLGGMKTSTKGKR